MTRQAARVASPGYSLVGLAVSTAIFLLTISGIVSGLRGLADGVNESRWRTLATVIAQDCLEGVKTGRLTAVPGRYPVPLPGYLRDELPRAEAYYAVEQREDGLLELTACAAWRGRPGRKQVTLVLLRPEEGGR